MARLDTHWASHHHPFMQLNLSRLPVKSSTFHSMPFLHRLPNGIWSRANGFQDVAQGDLIFFLSVIWIHTHILSSLLPSIAQTYNSLFLYHFDSSHIFFLVKCTSCATVVFGCYIRLTNYMSIIYVVLNLARWGTDPEEPMGL